MFLHCTHLWVTARSWRSWGMFEATVPYWEQVTLNKWSIRAGWWVAVFWERLPHPHPQGGSDTPHTEGQSSLSPLENYWIENKKLTYTSGNLLYTPTFFWTPTSCMNHLTSSFHLLTSKNGRGNNKKPVSKGYSRLNEVRKVPET